MPQTDAFPTRAMPPDPRVTDADLERGLQAALRGAPGDPAGLFGPASPVWRVNGEAVIFLGAARALLLQLAHPWVAEGIVRHSRALADPVGRFHRTFGLIYPMLFGTLGQASDAARRLHRRHAGVSGTLPAAAGRWAAGAVYAANDRSAMAWVQATLADTALRVYELALPPLDAVERERYWQDTRRLGGLFGLSPDDHPADWAGFQAAFSQKLDLAGTPHGELAVTDAARAVAQALFRDVKPWLRQPAWALDLTASLLPPSLRDGFGLPWDDARRDRVARLTDRLARHYRRLPRAIRQVGPWQEAQARLAGRPPSWAVRANNLLWLGRDRL